MGRVALVLTAVAGPAAADKPAVPRPRIQHPNLLTAPRNTALQLRGDSAVSFPIRVNEEVTLQFAEPSAAGFAKSAHAP